MSQLRAILFVAFAVFAAASAGCAGASARATAPQLPVRILSSEASSLPQPEAMPRDATPSIDADARRQSAPRLGAPRIGAPGGSGAGSRRVVPVQSGNETVGGLPAGTGAGGGVAGRG